MNTSQSYRRLFIVSMIAYAVVIVLLVFTLVKEPRHDHPLVGREATVSYGYAKGNSYVSSTSTGTVLAIDDGWITLSVYRTTTVTIPTDKVHSIRTD